VLLQGDPLPEILIDSNAKRIFFETLHTDTNAPEISGRITGTDLQEGYKSWSEKTSTSPSGLHLGHDKTMLHKTLQNDDIDLTAAFFDHKARMINLALDHRHVYTRWQTVITTMIEKIPGVPRLDKLRVIHIIESDFNLWMGIVCGQQMIFQAESMNLLGEEQSGSRPGKRCQDVVIFKHMTYSVLRLAKSDGITFDNDAKSCFDRIVLAAASLVLQRLGLSREVMELFIETLSKVEYFAKTYYGLSTMPYKETNAHGIHGPGQGGRASPAIWTAISCILLQCMRENSVGANITSPQGHQLQQVSSGFVDDITHWCIMMDNQNSLGESNEQTLMHHIEEMALVQDATECMISIPMYTRTSRIREPKTWEEYIAALPEWAGSTLQNMHIEEHTPIWLFPEDDHAPVYVVSDGSVIDHRGAYAWVIASSNKVLLSGRGSWSDGWNCHLKVSQSGFVKRNHTSRNAYDNGLKSRRNICTTSGSSSPKNKRRRNRRVPRIPPTAANPSSDSN
jgi:hypothetical protein